ncbi:glycosyltransferase family 2 protein [Exiguobacterium mexicanum]|uniref:Glycosyltransferase family 2 protein n=1 Tax=Exiguobacterium mexicanum TaxID=340146 RepID=A0ABT7MMD4_9BACL|nr:glycosyltransferase family 2 protein [Exiguobacterium mexicanum]MDL5376352.1 glycosyltransferase family 2 protein [Exiguobacterium mexicanum]
MMNTRPLVSIVIPVFNVEKYISETVHSVIAQTYSNLEIIIVDDGSEDKSFEICKEILKTDDRIKLLRIENSGVSTARNTGIDNAKGEYILFLDSDDIISSQLLEVCITKINDNPLCDIVIFGMIFEFINKNKLKSYDKKISKDQYFSSKQSHIHFRELFENNYLTSSCNKLIKTELIRTNNLYFDKKLSFLEDFCFSLDLYKNADSIIALKQPLYKYIHRKRYSLSVKYKEDMIEMISIIDEKIKNFFETVRVDAKTNSSINAFMSHAVSMCVINELNSDKSYGEKLYVIRNFIDQNWVQAYFKSTHSNSPFNNFFRFLAIKKKYRLIVVICKVKQMIVNGGRN